LQQKGIACAQASIAAMPFADKSFDLVMANEVLEHLDEALFAQGAREMERVAKRCILITVPNKDCFRFLRQECPRCRTVSVPWGHLRSFSAESMAEIFQGFQCCRVLAFGPRTADGNRLLTRVLGVSRWRGNALEPGKTCPVCGYTEPPVTLERPSLSYALRHPLAFARRGANRLALQLSPKSPRWLLALYRRSDKGAGRPSVGAGKPGAP